MEELRNLNNLNRGIHKRWIWGSRDNFYRSCDYLQKINFCIQDLNAEIPNLSDPSMKEVIFVIALIDWICEATNSIQKILMPNICAGFTYETNENVKTAEKYFKAIRSFMVAHPLNTNRHEDYGLDGDLICVDVRNKTSIITTCSNSTEWFYLGINGLQKSAKDISSDFVLYVYSQRIDKMQYFKYIKANFSDLYYVAELQIEKLYALDRYLGKLKNRCGGGLMSKLEELIAELCPDGVEYKRLGEIATDIFRGAGITRNQITETGIPCVRYGEIYTTYGVWFDKCISHTDEAKIASKKYFEYGDILFAITGESVDDIAKSCAYVGHEKCLAGGDIVVLKHEQNPKYLAYALSTTEAQQQKSKGKVKSKVVHSSVPAIQSIRIPVPPLPVQREIVRILDNFTELTVELTVELTARKKQYEFYRDKLLNFDVLGGGGD